MKPHEPNLNDTCPELNRQQRVHIVQAQVGMLRVLARLVANAWTETMHSTAEPDGASSSADSPTAVQKPAGSAVVGAAAEEADL